MMTTLDVDDRAFMLGSALNPASLALVIDTIDVGPLILYDIDVSLFISVLEILSNHGSAPFLFFKSFNIFDERGVFGNEHI